jgi:uncharacterized membrane protein (DUF485 family)
MTVNSMASRPDADITDRHGQTCRVRYESSGFKDLMRAKRRIVGPLLVATLGFFVSVTLLAGYAKEFMTARLAGSLNVGFGLILAVYLVCWAGALLYVHAADGEFDEMTRILVKEHHGRRK